MMSMPRFVKTRLSVALALVTLGGCASLDQNIRTVEAKVLPITVGQVAEVSAYDLAMAMTRAGFTSEHILGYGPAVRNALAMSGGAQIRNGDMISALFSAFDNKLYVTSRSEEHTSELQSLMRI